MLSNAATMSGAGACVQHSPTPSHIPASGGRAAMSDAHSIGESCPSCLPAHPAHAFTNRQGRERSNCRTCDREKSRLYRERNLERERERTRAYYRRKRDEICARKPAHNKSPEMVARAKLKEAVKRGRIQKP